MTKPQKPGSAQARKFKSDALDALVKRETEKKRAALESKAARLKALRLARDAAGEAAPAPAPAKGKEKTKE